MRLDLRLVLRLTLVSIWVLLCGCGGEIEEGAEPTGEHAEAITLRGRNGFSLAVTPSTATVTAGSAAVAYTVTTAVTSGSAQTINLSASGLPTGVTASFSPTSVSAGQSATLFVSAAQSAVPGTTAFVVTGSATSGSRTASASVTVLAAPPVGVLVNDVSVLGLAGSAGNAQFFSISVPAGQSLLTFKTSGGIGDADLYVKFGASPTTSAFDCRPFINGNTETCSFTNPTAGTWYVMLRAFSAYQGVSLIAHYEVAPATSATPLTNGVPFTGFSGAVNSEQFWKLTAPAGATIVFTISGGTGDADLYVRRGAEPTTAIFDCRPFINGNNETCTLTAPTAGDYFVMVRGFTAYSGVTLKALY
jgi:hypothetical protein